jgi:SAM-dependent methyltransferase
MPVHPRPGVVGTITRGTTNPNRLRRIDRYIAALPILRRTDDPIVADVGYGASAVTTLELERRLEHVRPDVEVVGIEVDPDRVVRAREQLAEVRRGAMPFAPTTRVSFERGGFEVPLPGGRRAAVIRAYNVLRQYREDEVRGAWDRMAGRLQPGGVLIEGTCDELGRIASWVDVTGEGPQCLTVSLRLTGLDAPGIVAERLPKALIHRNVPGEPVHAFVEALDAQWRRAAPLASFGTAQRWVAAVTGLRDDGWPVRGGKTRWKLGELTIDWRAVAP